MPYVGNTYVLPAVYLAIPGTTIVAVQHNVPLVDLQDAQNFARPISGGGTGSNNAAGALTNLGAAGTGTVNQFTATQSWSKGTDIASAVALALGTDGNYWHITGTDTITSISTKPVGTWIALEFDDALTLTNSANLILGGNIRTTAGDVIILISEGVTTWRLVSRSAASGSSTQVVSAASQIAFTGLSGFRALRLSGAVLVGTDGSTPGIQTSTNNGVSYDQAGGDYGMQVLRATSTVVDAFAQTSGLIILGGLAGSNVANSQCTFDLYISDFNQARHCHVTGTCFGVAQTSLALYTSTLAAYRGSNTARDALRILPSAGVLTGYATLEGIRG